MKTRILTFFSLVIIAGMLTIWSCKKDDEKVVTKEDAVAITTKDAASNSAYNDIYSESEAILANLEINNYPAGSKKVGGKVVTVTKNNGNTTAFPKEITVIYQSYTTNSGIKKNGTIKITQSAKMRESGAIRTVTLENFLVNDTVKLEGTLTITNMSAVNNKPSIKVELTNGKITFMNSGYYLTRKLTRTITWESGFEPASLLNIWDDVYSFSETVQGSSSNGFGYSSTTTIPLEYKIGELCIKKGKYEVNVENKVKAYLDFTRTTCLEKVKLIIEGDTWNISIW